MANGALAVIEEKQFTLFGHFHFTQTGLIIDGRPTFDDYENAGEFIRRSVKQARFWLADWLRYGETRKDWSEKLSQAQSLTGLADKTLMNIRSVGAIDPSVRNASVDFSLHEAVSAFPEKEQRYWLGIAESENFTLRDLRLAIRSARRPKVIEGQAFLEGRYRIIYADPAWLYDDRQPSATGAETHYPGMTIKELCELPIGSHSLRNAVLLMWVTSPLLLQNPGPREVGEAWGFEYKTNIVWDKVDGAGGNYHRGNHELLTIWTRGSAVPDVQQDLPDSVQTVKKSRVHSEKPEEFRQLIVKHWTHGPYLELFGRKKHDGWTVFGNDARLWAKERAS